MFDTSHTPVPPITPGDMAQAAGKAARLLGALLGSAIRKGTSGQGGGS